MLNKLWVLLLVVRPLRSGGSGVTIPAGDYYQWASPQTERRYPFGFAGGTDVCGQVTPGGPLATPCTHALNATCGQVRGPLGRSMQCEACALQHQPQLAAAGCNTSFEVSWCNSTAPPPPPPPPSPCCVVRSPTNKEDRALCALTHGVVVQAMNASCGSERAASGSMACEACCLEHQAPFTAAGCNISWEEAWCNSSATPSPPSPAPPPPPRPPSEKLSCKAGVCVVDPQGNYSSNSTCAWHCSRPPPPPTPEQRFTCGAPHVAKTSYDQDIYTRSARISGWLSCTLLAHWWATYDMPSAACDVHARLLQMGARACAIPAATTATVAALINA